MQTPIYIFVFIQTLSLSWKVQNIFVVIQKTHKLIQNEFLFNHRISIANDKRRLATRATRIYRSDSG